MDFKQSVITCFQKYVDFSGRASRPEFWWFALFSVLVQMVVQGMLGYWMGNVAALVLLLPSLTVGARRLHDIDKSGWFQLLWLVPLLGWAVMVYFLVQPTDPASNRYGEAPALPQEPAVPGTF